ncbi:hypothetical protein J437_LFUL002530 [Ladona fulva]|uniref:Uncharacterized protein n=1 Tax=Ladona fulva TaxID=123851 RepID=A0A8K0KYN8_LADFU|nr:hypothetical protein J437_LFUL002530 [Ladona fulva]
MNETKKFYDRVNIIRRPFKAQITMCKNKNGDIVSDKKAILQRWAEHSHELLNGYTGVDHVDNFTSDANRQNNEQKTEGT